jgi:hypothetical protein
VLGNIGESIGISISNAPLGTWGSIEAAFDNFSSDMLRNLESHSISAVSSFLIAEFSEAFDIPSDFGGQILTTVTSKITNTLITNVVKGAELFDGLLVFNDAGNWTGAGGIVTAVGSFLGSYLAHQVIEAETTAGAIGGSIGSALGSIAGVAAMTGGAGDDI